MAQNDGPVNAPYPTSWTNETFCRPGCLCSRPGYLGVASLSRSSARTLSAFLESGSPAPSSGATLAPGMLDSPSPRRHRRSSRAGPSLSLLDSIGIISNPPWLQLCLPLPAANCPTRPSGSPGASVNCRPVALSSIFGHVFSLQQQLMVSGASSQLRRHQTEPRHCFEPPGPPNPRSVGIAAPRINFEALYVPVRAHAPPYQAAFVCRSLPLPSLSLSHCFAFSMLPHDCGACSPVIARDTQL